MKQSLLNAATYILRYFLKGRKCLIEAHDQLQKAEQAFSEALSVTEDNKLKTELKLKVEQIRQSKETVYKLMQEIKY